MTLFTPKLSVSKKGPTVGPFLLNTLMEHYENFFEFLDSLYPHVRQKWINYFRNQVWAPTAVITIEQPNIEELKAWLASNALSKYAHMQYGHYHMFAFESTKEALYFKVVWSNP